MKKIKNLLLIITALLCLNSCDILDLKPQDKLSETDVWNDPILMQLYVNGCYNGIHHGFTSSALFTYCDEAYNDASGKYGAFLAGDLDQDNVSQMSVEINLWSAAYGDIRKINTFFEKVETSAANADERKSMIGEMKFIRAFIYSNLICRYGGVPLITKVYKLNEEYRVPRNTYDECVKFIVDELGQAKDMLLDKQPDEQRGRASADACRALISRVLLYAASPLNNPTNDRQKWEAASEAAFALIDTRYQLHDDYRMTFMTPNNEIIFARWFTQSNSTDINQWYGRSGSGGHGGMTPTQNIVNAYEMKATGKTPYTEQADGNLILDPTSGYDPQNPYAGRDPRFDASIIHDETVWAGRVTDTWDGGVDSPIVSYNASETRYNFKKFVTESIAPSGSTQKPENPWIYFRYAEILLNYAEAQFHLNEEEAARTFLNRVRSRVGVEMPDVTESGAALEKRIQHERRIELAFEYHRFFDVRRWNIAEVTEKQPIFRMRIIKDEAGEKTYSEEVMITRKFFKHQYLIPIPREEIEKSLNSLVQNSGYTK